MPQCREMIHNEVIMNQSPTINTFKQALEGLKEPLPWGLGW
jgi:hypothetical protein